ncbi:type 4a pilus biogenesis protein PilO [Marisediminicola sp. LYQ85]|uniref:type 4a pilus biogenesis protein PilO n=1 Tax=Marisediminicola sp. LYQ85 TaxID=3391062 RepID=UPI003983835A
MTERIWLIGASLLIVAIVALGWLLGISPQVTAADEARAEKEGVEQQNAAQEIALIQLRDQFENMDVLEDQLSELESQIPPRQDFDVFLDDIVGLASDAGVALTGFTASEALAYASEAEGDAAPADPTVAATGTFTIPITISLEGSPQQILDFTAAVQESTRLTLVTNVTFSSGDGAAGTVTGHLFVVRGSAGATAIDEDVASETPADAAPAD